MSEDRLIEAYCTYCEKVFAVLESSLVRCPYCEVDYEVCDEFIEKHPNTYYVKIGMQEVPK